MTSLADREDRLIWILGSSRSGSTWLLRMLSDFPDVVPIDDPHLGHHLGIWRPIPLAWGACEELPELSTLAELKAEQPGYFFADRYRESWWEPLRALIRARFEAQAEGRKSARGDIPIYVVKEPGSQAAPLLAELFPASKLIFLLRDGRDVVDSWLDAYRKGSWAIPGGAFPVAQWGRIPLIRWLSAVWVYRSRAVRQAFEVHDPGSRILVRYEDLRTDTGEILKAICELVGLDGEAASSVGERHRFEQAPAQLRGARRELRLAQPGAWRENLSEAEQLEMHRMLGGALEEFGYGDPSPAQPPAMGTVA